jgi:hypothetical protein
MSAAPADVVALVRRLAQAPLRADARFIEVERALCALDGLEHPTTFLHRRHGHVYQLGRTPELAAEERVLAELAPLALSIAPRVVERLEFAPGETLLVTHYAACKTGRLEAPPKHGGLAAPARQRFLADMEALWRSGRTHAWAARGTGAWLVASDSGAIVLTGWAQALQPLPPGTPEAQRPRL